MLKIPIHSSLVGKKKNLERNQREHTHTRVFTHTYTHAGCHDSPTGIDVLGLMSKIQLHRFKLLESGQSWEGIAAESMRAFLYQKSLIWQAYLFLKKKKEEAANNVFYAVCFLLLYLPVLSALWKFGSSVDHPLLKRGGGEKTTLRSAALHAIYFVRGFWPKRNPVKNKLWIFMMQL